MALPRLFRTYNSRQRGTLRAAGSYRCHWQHLNDTVLCACLEKREERLAVFQLSVRTLQRFIWGRSLTPPLLSVYYFDRKGTNSTVTAPFVYLQLKKVLLSHIFIRRPESPLPAPHIQRWKSFTDAAWTIGIRNEVAITFTAVCTHLVHAPAVDTHPCHGTFIDIW